MKPTEQLKESTNQLEKEISSMIDAFIEKNGVCDIRIDTNITYIHDGSGASMYAGKEVKVWVTI